MSKVYKTCTKCDVDLTLEEKSWNAHRDATGHPLCFKCRDEATARINEILNN